MRFATDRARVRVPATSANLGPGFDSFGLALSVWDEVGVEAITGTTTVHVSGEGAGRLPGGEEHLIVRALRVALDFVDAPQAGFVLRCHNRIPHGRGLGSSAAATVAGLMLARGLISEPEALNDEVILALATEFAGHPDNAAPAIYGGATIAFLEEGRAWAATIPLAELSPVLLVPEQELATSNSRGALPSHVPHTDAAFTAARAGLLSLALSGATDLLFAATEDRLHQHYRAGVMPQTAQLIADLRGEGAAAVVSGAGPSVLVLAGFSPAAARHVPSGWRTWEKPVALRGAHPIRASARPDVG